MKQVHLWIMKETRPVNIGSNASVQECFCRKEVGTEI